MKENHENTRLYGTKVEDTNETDKSIKHIYSCYCSLLKVLIILHYNGCYHKRSIVMNTKEHTELGNALRFDNWHFLKNNPFVRIDDQGVLHLNLQGISSKGLPEANELVVPAGVVIGMSGDYFGGREVDLQLPSIAQFRLSHEQHNAVFVSEQLGKHLIKEPITETEQQKIMRSYKRLANRGVTTDDIDTIYQIDNANYVPFSSTLNSYMQQIMFALRVRNYSEMLNRNLAHFTPWSVRVYILGHNIALKYAKIASELSSLATDENYQSTNEDYSTVVAVLKDQTQSQLTPGIIQEYVHRYQALALGMELFCFHYYTDHYAAGHGAFLGDLRAILPQRFGYIGGVLVNNLHDELNKVTVYTQKPYDPTPDLTEAPVKAAGDGDFDQCNNSTNRQSCISGMQASLNDIHRVISGDTIPAQHQYGGLEHLPDIDINYRQPQPLFLLGKGDRVYYRTNLSRVRIFSPSELRDAYHNPLQHGYTELTSIFEAFSLCCKLRFFPSIFGPRLQPLSDKELASIEQEEQRLNPKKSPVPRSQVVAEPLTSPRLHPSQWRSTTPQTGCLRNHGLFATRTKIHPVAVPQPAPNP